MHGVVFPSGGGRLAAPTRGHFEQKAAAFEGPGLQTEGLDPVLLWKAFMAHEGETARPAAAQQKGECVPKRKEH